MGISILTVNFGPIPIELARTEKVQAIPEIILSGQDRTGWVKL